jgi:dTDP-4-amino-4,6-dideoxygalactose transaminase
VACFSFHPRKIISIGDGGMLTTRRREWDEKFRLWRQHGMSISDTARHASARVVFEEYAELGFNYRMTDIQAAIGREQLKRLPHIVGRRRELAAAYRAALTDVPNLALPVEPEWARSNWQSFCLRVPRDLDRGQIMQMLLESGISTRRGIMCAHREPAYRNQPWRGAGSLHRSEEAQDTGLILPLYPQMDPRDQAAVVLELKQALAAECVC